LHFFVEELECFERRLREVSIVEKAADVCRKITMDISGSKRMGLGSRLGVAFRELVCSPDDAFEELQTRRHRSNEP